MCHLALNRPGWLSSSMRPPETHQSCRQCFGRWKFAVVSSLRLTAAVTSVNAPATTVGVTTVTVMKSTVRSGLSAVLPVTWAMSGSLLVDSVQSTAARFARASAVVCALQVWVRSRVLRTAE